MGEAKRRKNIDPYYGVKPKYGRGIILSKFAEKIPSVIMPDGTVDKGCFALRSPPPEELRYCALFWDRIASPVYFANSVEYRDNCTNNFEYSFLEKEGIFIPFNVSEHVDELTASGNAGKNKDAKGSFLSTSPFQVFNYYNKREPGNWVFSASSSSQIPVYLSNLKLNFVSGRGQLVTLTRAIPIPNPDFPISELLEFKRKRLDEIYALTSELDKFYSQIVNHKDPDFELNRLLRVVDRQCADMVKVASESKYKFHLSDISYSLSLDNIESSMKRAGGLGSGVLLGTGSYPLALTAAAIGGAASFISFGRGFGVRHLRDRSKPFQVVATMHKELVS